MIRLHCIRVPALLLLLASPLACGESGSDDNGGETSSDSSDSSNSTSEDTSETDTDAETDTGPGASVEVHGDAFPFSVGGGRISDAAVTILELPELATTTDEDGHFVFPALPPGAEVTFRFEKAGNPIVYTKTFTLPAEDGALFEQVTFQVPDNPTYDALAVIVGYEPDPATCQIASTVTRVGKSLYDPGAHGESGATVTIEPALAPEQGPIYFNDLVIPQHDLVETSTDGGVLYMDVPPGTYTLTAHKEGVEFESAIVRCDAGVLVNPAPPRGLQALP